MTLNVTGSLADRTTSSIGLSIGTDLALETLFTGTKPVYDPERIIPPRVELTDYQEFWINLNTLYRNILGSVSSAAAKSLMPSDILDVLEYEAELLMEIVNKNTMGSVKPVLYYSHYKGLERKHPHAKHRKDTTDNQKAYSAIKDKVCEEYVRRHKKENKIVEFDRTLKPANKTKILILTHDAYDLLSKKNFSDMHLIESHTGKLKKFDQWWTKLSNSKELMRMPLNGMTIQVFGDSQHFLAMDSKIKQAVMETATQRNWTPVTTQEKIALSLNLMPDKFSGLILQEMLKEI